MLIFLFLCIVFSVVKAGSLCQEVKLVRIAECGNATMSEIISKGIKCEIANRLNAFALWLAERDKPCSAII